MVRTAPGNCAYIAPARHTVENWHGVDFFGQVGTMLVALLTSVMMGVAPGALSGTLELEGGPVAGATVRVFVGPPLEQRLRCTEDFSETVRDAHITCPSAVQAEPICPTDELSTGVEGDAVPFPIRAITAVTDATGHFTLSASVDERATVSFWKRGVGGGLTSWGERSFTFGPPTQLSIIVVDERTQPVVGASVSAVDLASLQRAKGSTTAEGRFEVPVVGTNWVRISKPGFLSTAVFVDPLASEMPIVLRASRTLTVRTQREGKPVEAEVAIVGCARSARTTRGQVVLRGLRRDTFTLLSRAGKLGALPREVDASTGATLELALEPVATLELTVRGEAGAPLSGVRVTGHTADFGATVDSGRLASDGRGVLTLGPVALGVYELTLHGSDGAVTVPKVELGAGLTRLPVSFPSAALRLEPGLRSPTK